MRYTKHNELPTAIAFPQGPPQHTNHSTTLQVLMKEVEDLYTKAIEVDPFSVEALGQFANFKSELH